MKNACECFDRQCPEHEGLTCFGKQATIVLYRVDMTDRSGTAFCAGCAEDALESGLFSTDKG